MPTFENEKEESKNRGAEGVGCGEGVSPSPPGVGSGEGAVPPSQKIFGFLTSKWWAHDSQKTVRLTHMGYSFTDPRSLLPSVAKANGPLCIPLTIRFVNKWRVPTVRGRLRSIYNSCGLTPSRTAGHINICTYFVFETLISPGTVSGKIWIQQQNQQCQLPNSVP